MRGDALWFNPCIPQDLARLDLCLRYRGHTLDVGVTQDRLTVSAHASNAAPIRIGFGPDLHEIAAGESKRFDL
jgi:alpha,alpha-trehalase